MGAGKIGRQRFRSGGHDTMESHPPVPASGIVIRPRSDAKLPGDDASRCQTGDSRAEPARWSPRRRLRHDHSRHEARHGFRFGSLRAQCATPSQKLRAGDTVSPRRRGDEARAGQALQDDPGLLVLRPAPAPARLDDLKPPKGTVRMTVHTHCSQREEHHAARRPSPDGYERTSLAS